MPINDQLILISGESASGKTASLRNLRNQEKVMYLNCEAGKRPPFANNFDNYTITDSRQVYEAFDFAKGNPDYEVIVIDSISFLMDLYESENVLPATDTQKAWGQYAQYYKRLMSQYVASSDKAVIVLGHTLSEYDDKKLQYRVRLAVKGAIGKGTGGEAYFSTVVSTKRVELTELEDYESDLLNITEEDELLGFKHVFQTKLTKETVGERIRSPMKLFSNKETFIDNDAQLLLDHLNAFYGTKKAA